MEVVKDITEKLQRMVDLAKYENDSEDVNENLVDAMAALQCLRRILKREDNAHSDRRGPSSGGPTHGMWRN